MASEKISRRQFHKRITGTVAGMLLGGNALGQETTKSAEDNIAAEKWLDELQKQRSSPLTPAQRKGALANYKDLQQSLETIRKYPVRDTSEPQLIFRPVRRGKEKR